MTSVVVVRAMLLTAASRAVAPAHLTRLPRAAAAPATHAPFPTELLPPHQPISSYLVQDPSGKQVTEDLLPLLLSDASVNRRGHFIDSSLPVGILFQLGLRSAAPLHHVLQGFLELLQQLLELLGFFKLSMAELSRGAPYFSLIL